MSSSSTWTYQSCSPQRHHLAEAEKLLTEGVEYLGECVWGSGGSLSEPCRDLWNAYLKLEMLSVSLSGITRWFVSALLLKSQRVRRSLQKIMPSIWLYHFMVYIYISPILSQGKEGSIISILLERILKSQSGVVTCPQPHKVWGGAGKWITSCCDTTTLTI